MKLWLPLLFLAACAGDEKTTQAEYQPGTQTNAAASVPGSTLDAELHFDRGVALAAQGRDTEAIDAYLQAANLAPNYKKVHYNLANAYARQLSYVQAIKAYQRVLAMDSMHVSARHNLAAMYVRQLNYTQAIAEHKKVLTLDPSHITTYYDLGYIHFLRGEYERVRELIAAGQQHQPQNASFYRLLGRVHAKELDFAAARTALKRSIALDSTDAATYVDLAQVDMKLRDYAAAERASRLSMRLAPLEKEAYFVFANALRRQSRGAESKEIMTQFRALDKQLDKIEDQLRMLGNDPDDHEARAMLGLLYSRQGRYKEGVEAYRLATRLAPDSLSYHNNLGNLYLRLHQHREATIAYKRAIYARDGDYAQAAEALAQAVESKPDLEDARQKLAISYLKLGRKEESKIQLQLLKEMQEEAGAH
jgi:tetratricopeptide (TPR) repeat protein